MPKYASIELGSLLAVRDFAYKGKKAGFIGFSEDDVKDAVKSALQAMSYDVKVMWGKKHGVDIEATLGGTKILIEAIGEGASRQHLGNNFLRVLAEILLRMTDEQASYGIALPAHPSLIDLVASIPKRVRQGLRLDFYFVKPSENLVEVGCLRSHNE
jgi:hypothetical protein